MLEQVVAASEAEQEKADPMQKRVRARAAAASFKFWSGL